MSVDKFCQIIKDKLPNLQVGCIFEVGSWNCNQALELRSVFPNANMFSFEPNWDTLPLCFINAAKGNITVVPAAVAVKDGLTTFYASTTENHGYSSVFKPSGKYDHIERMPTNERITPSVRLDTFIDYKKCPIPDLMWLDAQGSDLNAMKSLGEYIGGVSAIWCEVLYGEMYTGQCFRDEIVEFLTKSGFEINHEQVVYKHGATNWWGDMCFIRRHR